MATLCCFEKPASYHTATLLHKPGDRKLTFFERYMQGGEKFNDSKLLRLSNNASTLSLLTKPKRTVKGIRTRKFSLDTS